MCATALARPVTLSEHPATARRQLTEKLVAADWPSEPIDGVLLAVHEALVNAQRHAGGICRAKAGFDGHTLVVEVWDRGGGFPMPPSEAAPDTWAEHGRGLFLMCRLATEVEVFRRGGEVCLRLKFEP
ncbi:MAG: ATP-binding protein [Actinomycetota bacterium]|nr:ATP-binding protein [Actinomycetota bacterium]